MSSESLAELLPEHEGTEFPFPRVDTPPDPYDTTPPYLARSLPSRPTSHTHAHTAEQDRRKSEDRSSTTSTARLLARLAARDTKHARTLLALAHDRLEAETRRADGAEQRVVDVLARLRAAHESGARARAEAGAAQQEVRLYRLQLEAAQREIARAQEVVDGLERARAEAEEEAAKARSVARRCRERWVLERAREQGRQEGFVEGLQRARRQVSVVYRREEDDEPEEEQQDEEAEEAEEEEAPPPPPPSMPFRRPASAPIPDVIISPSSSPPSPPASSPPRTRRQTLSTPASHRLHIPPPLPVLSPAPSDAPLPVPPPNAARDTYRPPGNPYPVSEQRDTYLASLDTLVPHDTLPIPPPHAVAASPSASLSPLPHDDVPSSININEPRAPSVRSRDYAYAERGRDYAYAQAQASLRSPQSRTSTRISEFDILAPGFERRFRSGVDRGSIDGEKDKEKEGREREREKEKEKEGKTPLQKLFRSRLKSRQESVPAITVESPSTDASHASALSAEPHLLSPEHAEALPLPVFVQQEPLYVPPPQDPRFVPPPETQETNVYHMQAPSPPPLYVPPPLPKREQEEQGRDGRGYVEAPLPQGVVYPDPPARGVQDVPPRAASRASTARSGREYGYDARSGSSSSSSRSYDKIERREYDPPRTDSTSSTSRGRKDHTYNPPARTPSRPTSHTYSSIPQVERQDNPLPIRAPSRASTRSGREHTYDAPARSASRASTSRSADPAGVRREVYSDALPVRAPSRASTGRRRAGSVASGRLSPLSFGGGGAFGSFGGLAGSEGR